MSGRPLQRRSYSSIALYAPDRAPCPVDLSDNTNLFGVPPAALEAARTAGAATFARYPRLYADALKAALADYIGVGADAIATGCGSDDVLDSAIRAFCEPGDRIAYSDPTFSMLPLFARMNGLEAAEVPLRPDLDVDAEALLATGARVIYVCSPNNPTANAASAAAVARVLEGARGVVILDEAYAEYARESFAARAPERPNLLVLRTLSKAFGLAGARIGYAVGAPALVAEVEKSRGPYKVNALAEAMAVAALRQDRAWVQARVDEAIEVRARFCAALVERGYAPLPTQANFVLVPVRDASGAAQAARTRGVAFRPFPALRGIGDGLRISVGPWPLMQAALDALAEVAPCA